MARGATILRNAGTDFAPLIEAFAKRAAAASRPATLTVPHEVPAVAMAHGYAMVTGRTQAVWCTFVGAANAIGDHESARATRDLFTAGRNPSRGRHAGSRDRRSTGRRSS